MLRLTILCCALWCLADANQLEDHCVITFLRQRNLLNSTTFPNTGGRARKNCDQIVKKIVKSSFDENFDYLDEDSSVDNKTYRECLKSEFNRHKLDVKFLKTKIFTWEPQKSRLEAIRDDFLSKIKFNCSGALGEQSELRFKDFITEKIGVSPKLSRHPAILKIRENLACMNRYAVDKGMLDLASHTLKLKLFNQTEDDCKHAVKDVTTLIVDEWHIRSYSDDDEIQRCFIEILYESGAIDAFIRKTLLSQLPLTQAEKDAERNVFMKSMSAIHESAYKCSLKDFERI